MRGPNRYFLLDEPVPGHRVPDLLGRAVIIEDDALKLPTQSGQMIPQLPPDGPNLSDLVTDLYPAKVKAKDANVLLRHASDKISRLSIINALNLFHKNRSLEQRNISTPAFSRITMEEPELKIRKLLATEPYGHPIVELFHSHPTTKLGIIVSIISCFEMEVAQNEAQESEGGGEITIPRKVAEAGGLDNVVVDLKAGAANKNRVSGIYRDEVIIACGYVQMQLKNKPSWWNYWNWGLWTSHNPSPHDITVTAEAIHPGTMTIFVPPGNINGDSTNFLGGKASTQHKQKVMDGSTANDPEMVDDSDSEFLLYQ